MQVLRSILPVFVACLLFLFVSVSYAELSCAHFSVRLQTRSSYRSGIPVLVRVEVIDESGRIERGLWDATAMLFVNDPNVAFAPAEIQLYNGLGSALVTFGGARDFVLTAEVAGLQTSRSFDNIDDQPIVEAPPILTGDHTVWSDTIRVREDLIVPSGHALSVEPGTMILLDGVDNGTNGTDIDIQGSLQSLGTAEQPVTFTAFRAGENWGELHFDDAEPSVLRYTNITRAGHSPKIGHSNSGPALRVSGTTLVFQNVNCSDNAGKVMHATSDSDLTFVRCLLARSVMGPEISATALLFENSWIIGMSAKDDADGIYVHSQMQDQICMMQGGVAADIVDDGIDLLGADITIRNFIVRDCDDKGISAFNGNTTITNCLVVNNNRAPEDPTVASIAAKAREGVTTTVTMDRTTVVTTRTPGVVDHGIQSHEKYGYTTGAIIWHVTNSIIDATDPIDTEFPYLDSDVHVSHSNVFGESWPGTGNINADPLFVDPSSGNYRLKSQAGHWSSLDRAWIADEVTSPCIDAGDPASPIGDEPFPNGGLVNMGFYAATAEASKSWFDKPVCETVVAGDINGDCVVDVRDFALMSLHWLRRR